MNDEIDSSCPECALNVAYGECRCDGGDLVFAGVERYVEFHEAGRAKTRRTQRRRK